MHRDVVDADTGVVEASHPLCDASPATTQRQRQHTALALRAILGNRDERLYRGLGRGAVVERDLEPLAAHPVLQLVRGAFGDHPAAVDHRDRVGEPVRLVQVLGREQDGGAGRHAGLDRLPELEAAARVEPGGGLVQEDHRRADHERRRQVEPAAHAARVRLREPVRGVGQGEALEQLAGALLCRPAAHVVEPADHLEVLVPGQVLVDRRVLAGEADLGSERGSVPDHVEPGNARRAAVRREQRREDAYGRGLAGPVRAEQAQHGAPWYLEVDPVEGVHVLERLPKVVSFDGCVGHAQHSRERPRAPDHPRATGPPDRGSCPRTARRAPRG